MLPDLFAVLRDFFTSHGYWALAVTLLLENAGIPLPGETMLLFAGFLAFEHAELNLVLIILVGTVACTLGDNLGYWIGNRGGRPCYCAIRRCSESPDERIDARGKAVRTLWTRHRFLRPLHLRHARTGWASGRRAAHALAAFCPVQLSGCGRLGDCHIDGRISFWAALEALAPHCERGERRCLRSGRDLDTRALVEIPQEGMKTRCAGYSAFQR